MTSTDTGPEVRPHTVDELLREYDEWGQIAARTDDPWDLVARTRELYRFAIVHYNDPGIELLLKAIRTLEAVESET